MSAHNVILIGFMGTGKTTAGRLCAEKLGYTFLDSDAIIEERAGCSIAHLFTTQGEAAFRHLEREVIAELAANSGAVIATGGGAPLDAENAALLRAAGTVVLLTATPDALLMRVGEAESRPLLAGAADPRARIARMLSEREKRYARIAHLRIDTSEMAPEAIADAIMGKIKTNRKTVDIARCIPVGLGGRSYNIHIAGDLLRSGRAAEILSSIDGLKQACLVTHPGLRVYANIVAQGLRRAGILTTMVTIPAGERTKNLGAVARLYGEFLRAGLDRKSLVVAVGGGVLGDLVGFASATYLRGVRFAQIPTTLLAQVDASVGGKTGVDLPEGKNLVGAFHQPSSVLIDLETLVTLPARELRAGLAEVIKYGIIYDSEFFTRIVSSLPALLRKDRAELGAVIARSCEIKAEVVGQDETEQGLRAILNFGHTIGHALEAVTDYRRYKHGEAVAIGMVSAALIGEEIGVTPGDVTQEIQAALQRARLPVAFPEDISVDRILLAARHDKKAQAGRIHFVLARRMGEVFTTGDVPENAVRSALGRQTKISDHVRP